MTASCAASGMVMKHAIASKLGTRISGLFCGEERRWERHFGVWRSNMTDPLGPRPTAGRDGPADFGVQHGTVLAPGMILPCINTPARGVPSLARAAIAALIAAITCPSWAAAQTTLRGYVLDSEMGNTLPGASVRIGADTAVVKTDTAGFFRIAGLRGGVVDVHILMIGYEEGVFRMRLPDSGTVERLFSLDFNGFMLPDGVIQASAVLLQP